MKWKWNKNYFALVGYWIGWAKWLVWRKSRASTETKTKTKKWAQTKSHSLCLWFSFDLWPGGTFHSSTFHLLPSSFYLHPLELSAKANDINSEHWDNIGKSCRAFHCFRGSGWSWKKSGWRQARAFGVERRRWQQVLVAVCFLSSAKLGLACFMFRAGVWRWYKRISGA